MNFIVSSETGRETVREDGRVSEFLRWEREGG
jgi:hypothetical protein